MKILHYSLGFPPYRTGGLTKFCYDLMLEQAQEGNQVSLLWPGEIRLFDHAVHIKKNRPVNNIASYEIINPIPISYDEGIVDLDIFMNEGDINVYYSFLKKIRPDIIHIHTLMGLHKSFLLAAKKQKIRLVFTTHDFFPICPKVTMFRSENVCQTVMDCSYCPVCNLTALSEKKMWIMQTPVYRDLKDNIIVKKMRKSQRDEYLSDNAKIKGVPKTEPGDYQILRSHYVSMLEMMDFIHYNSTLTKNIYDQYLGKFPGKILPITHADIEDHKKKKDFNHKTLRFTYLGPQSSAKGFFYLKESLDKLWKKRKNFLLNVFFRNSDLPPYIKQHDRYSYSQLSKIMDHTDVVITPSMWYETFGFTVLEALSYGVPVIVSDRVGARDIIPEGGGIIAGHQNLEEVLGQLTIRKLEKMNCIIVDKMNVLTIDVFNQLLMENAYNE